MPPLMYNPPCPFRSPLPSPASGRGGQGPAARVAHL